MLPVVPGPHRRNFKTTRPTQITKDEIMIKPDENDDTNELEFYIDNAGEHRWRLRCTSNGEIVAAASEGFSSLSVAKENLVLTFRGLQVALSQEWYGV